MSDYRNALPWQHRAAPNGVFRNKCGSLSRVFAFRGIDVECCDYAQRLAVSESVTLALRLLWSGWYAHIESARVACSDYPPEPHLPTAASHLCDWERRRQYNEAGEQYETRSRLVLTQRMPGKLRARLGGLFVQGQKNLSQRAMDGHLERFLKTTNDFAELMRASIPAFSSMSDGAALRYLKNSISTNDHPIVAEAYDSDLSYTLPDQSLQNGDSGLSMLGDHYMAVSVVSTGLRGPTYPQILEQLQREPFPIRQVSRIEFIDRPAAKAFLAAKINEHRRGKKGLFGMLESLSTGVDTGTDDHEAESYAAAAAHAQAMLAQRGLCRLATSFVVLDKDPVECKRKQEHVRGVLQTQGFSVIDETLRLYDSWLGSIPGNIHDGRPGAEVNCRQAADIIALGSVWTGDEYDEHLAKTTGVARPHFFATANKTPVRGVLSRNSACVGLVLGSIGSGKSTFVNAYEEWAQGWPGARIIHIESGGANIGACMANGGTVYRFGNHESSLRLQPLAAIDDPAGRARACEWLYHCYQLQGLEMTYKRKAGVDRIVAQMAGYSAPQRTMTLFWDLIGSQGPELKSAIQPYTSAGNYGYLFDGDSDIGLDSHWITFELDDIFKRPPEVRIPLLMYLLQQVDRCLGTHPTFINLDEVWRAFDTPELRDWLMEAIRTYRARGGRLLLATQEIGTLVKNQELLVALESAKTWEVYGADRALSTAGVHELYRNTLNLSDAELDIISRQLVPGREYYLRVASRGGARKFPLEAGPVLLACAGMTSAEDQEVLAEIERTRPRHEWLRAMLEHRRIDDPRLHDALLELDRWEQANQEQAA